MSTATPLSHPALRHTLLTPLRGPLRGPLRRALLGLGLGLALAGAAQARPSNEVTTEYFSDAAHGRLVGETILSCAGSLRSWGRRTAYAVKHADPCDGRSAAAQLEVSHYLLHHDPAAACRARCIIKFPLRSCAPDEDCGGPRRACEEACNQLMKPEAEAN